ncbi:MAG: hypothetical protein P4L50_17215 [Anaerolineaceae bacterium]|nr:hypothetical protein [Anaerolineaceae bacterium]
MIISIPEITLKNGEVIVSTKVTFQKPVLNKPETAWFAFPERFLPYISGRADAFAAGLLPLAMVIQEDMHIEGSLSPRLAYGLLEYQQALNFWFPKQLAQVAIHAADLTSLPLELAGQSCVTLFSGGVDSCFTLMSHQPDHQPNPDFQTKYAIFVQGFDIPLQNRPAYEESLKIFSQQLAPLGVEIIPCRTNLHYFTSGLLNWGIAHGGAIIATGLILDKLIRYFLVPSSYSLEELVPWGSSPMTDHWLSTETLQVNHHGASLSRIEKVAAISTWPPAQRFLRVCVDENKRFAVNNCSQCEKCIRTMVMLEICGSLKSFATFKQPFGRWDIIKWVPHYDSGDVWLPQTLQYAVSRGKTEYIIPLWIANLRGKLRLWFRKMIPEALFKRLKEQKFPYQKDIFNPIYLDKNS